MCAEEHCKLPEELKEKCQSVIYCKIDNDGAILMAANLACRYDVAC